MKKAMLFSMIVLVGLVQACKPEEQLRVEKVIAGYNYTSRCEVYDLVAQGNPTVTLDTAILFVTRPLEDENGYIGLLDDEVYLNKDLSFNKSLTNYSLSGKFDGAGGLSISTDMVDQNLHTRTKCSYSCTKQ